MPNTASDLLDPNLLQGMRIGLSASESGDLARLGLMEIHFRVAIAEIARSVLVGGGKLAYRGHLNPNGYTNMLIGELQRYSRRDKPLQIILAWTEHRRLKLSELRLQKEELGLFGDIVCLDIDGNPTAMESGRGEEAMSEMADDLQRESLTNLRRFMADRTNARVLIGGKRTGYLGNMPGVLEKAIISLEKARPLYLVGGFGGITLDIIRAIDPTMAEWLPPSSSVSGPDEKAAANLSRLAAIARERGTALWNNGLTPEENALLAATHRPSEIASLVSVGLRRCAVQGAAN